MLNSNLNSELNIYGEQPPSSKQSFEEFKDYIPPDWHEWFMRHVYLVATKSKDRSSKIGAILVRDRRLISAGYNGICIGVNDKIEARHQRPEKYKWFEHGERNAILSAARNGISTLDAVMYTNGIPCVDCCRSIIQAGIIRVFVHKQWGDVEKLVRQGSYWTGHNEVSIQMFKEAGISLLEFDKELGIYGYIDGKKILV